jgi:hypothetical protein
MKILLRDFTVKLGKGIFSNQQLGMTVYIRIVIIMAVGKQAAKKFDVDRQSQEAMGAGG